MELYKRTYYLKKIRGFYHDYEMIKVITGIRRCGKSCLMRTITEELLKAHDVTQSQIIYINLDDKENKSIRTGEQLEKRIDELSITKKPKYLFIISMLLFEPRFEMIGIKAGMIHLVVLFVSKIPIPELFKECHHAILCGAFGIANVDAMIWHIINPLLRHNCPNEVLVLVPLQLAGKSDI